MNTISGKITHKETSLGIPDLLVVIYDVDPNTRLEEVLAGAIAPTGATISTQPVAFPPGDRLVSVATDSEGEFEFSYEDGEFKIRNEEEKRPDLLLMVLAPEEVGQEPGARILYISTDIRQNAGRSEAYRIRLTTEQLTRAGIALPTTAQENAEASQSVLTRLQTFEARREELTAGVKSIARNRVESVRSRLGDFETQFKPQLQNALSQLTENVVAPERVVLPSDSVLDKYSDVIRNSIVQVVNNEQRQRRMPVRSFINLSDAQKAQLETLADPQGSVSDEDIDRVLERETTEQNSNAFLIRENPVLQLCRDMTERERECAQLLGELPAPTEPTNPTEPAIPTEPENPELVDLSTFDELSEEDLHRHLTHLLGTMTSPEEEVVNGLTPRATDTLVQKQIRDLSLEKSPADTPAYHDFHNLQIAFEHVWQEAIDEDILGLAENAYDLIVELGGNPDALNTGSNPSRRLIKEANLVLKAHRDHRKGEDGVNASGGVTVSATAGGRRGRIRDHRDSPTIRDHRDGEGRGTWSPGGTRTETSTAPVDKLPQVLAELEQRLKEPYNFTVYAANRRERSVNFGLLLTYRQKWMPEAYQAGELVKTLTLAPRQAQKISVTRKVHKKRFRKEVENNVRSLREETSQTNRAEQEIIRRASAKTNFNVTAQESVSGEVPGMGGASSSITTSFGHEASKTSDDVKKSFHEAVFKAAQEFKTERTTEITTEDTEDFETVETTEITNPNDEIAVTFLFYELQRRYRVSEAIHKLTPVVLVAQEMPRPQDIDADWLLTHDWILRRVILDDSFLPAFDYLAENVAGDEVALDEMRINIEQQRDIVAELKQDLVAARRRADLQGAVIERSVWQRFADNSDGDGGGWLDTITSPISAIGSAAGGAVDMIGGALSGAADKIGDAIFGPDTPKGQTTHDAMKEAAERAADEARDLMFRLEREVSTLNALLEKYAKAYSEHVNRLTQIARLRVHIKQNILYYMQAIWNHEPPDQRFFRLHNTKVPKLQKKKRRFNINLNEVRSEALAGMAHRTLARFSSSPVRTYPAEIKCEINPQLEYAALSELADLDTLLGFKGNYAIFPLKQSNALTDFMMEPYVDRAFNMLIDPDDIGNWTLEEFASYVCCLKQRLTADEFNSIKEQLKAQYKQLLSAPRRNGDILAIPSGSLFIEALPAEHSLIEEFKSRHRAVDVKKAQAEVRKLELENIRYAARVLDDNYEDPEIDKKIVIEGGSSIVVPPEA